MAIYEILGDGFRKVETTSFSDAGIQERADLQRLLRSNVEVISPETIAAQVPWRRNSMFRSAEGDMDSAAFVQCMRREEEDGGRRFEERRFYFADDDLIHAEGRTYAFTNQWGHRTISAINHLIQAFSDHQITCAKSEEEV